MAIFFEGMGLSIVKIQSGFQKTNGRGTPNSVLGRHPRKVNMLPDFLKKKGGFTKFMYAIIPPFRKGFNKKRLKEIEKQLTEYKKWGEELRKLSFKIESVYTDGI